MDKINRFYSLRGKNAIVTGGSQGIGYGIVKCLADAGARVIVLGRRSIDEIDSQLFGAYKENIVYIQYDVTDTNMACEVVSGIIEKYGHIDILVNNAGIHCKKPIDTMSVEEYVKVLDVHLVGAFALTKAVFPYMRKQKNGSIVFLASMASYIGQPMVAGYASAKAGILGMVHTLAAEGGSDNIRVNAVAPGWIDTPMFHKAVDGDEVRKEKIMGRIPMKRVGDPIDIGNAVLFLSSNAADYITGVCLPVDGGGLIGF